MISKITSSNIVHDNMNVRANARCTDVSWSYATKKGNSMSQNDPVTTMAQNDRKQLGEGEEEEEAPNNTCIPANLKILEDVPYAEDPPKTKEERLCGARVRRRRRRAIHI